MEGYKKKPEWINVLALIYIIHPIGNTVFLMVKNSMSLSQVLQLAPWYYFLLICMSPFVAFGLIKVREWGWHLLILHTALAIFSCTYTGTDEGWRFPSTFWANFVFLIPVAYFLRKEIRAPYFNPRLRWWEQHKRLRDALKVTLEKENWKEELETFDISETGCFVQVDDHTKLSHGDIVKIHITLNDVEFVDTRGEVVWISEGTGQYPRGFGLKFNDLTKENKWTIDRHIRAALAATHSFSRA